MLDIQKNQDLIPNGHNDRGTHKLSVNYIIKPIQNKEFMKSFF